MTRKRNKGNPKPSNSIVKTTQSPADNHVVRRISAMRQFSGPLPPPDMLDKYNDAVPNGAERIIAMAEKQQNHRISLESYVITHNSSRSTLGLCLAFVLALITILGGLYLLYLGKSVLGLSVIFGNLVALCSVFVYTQKKNKEEREARNTTLTEKSSSSKK